MPRPTVVLQQVQHTDCNKIIFRRSEFCNTFLRPIQLILFTYDGKANLRAFIFEYLLHVKNFFKAAVHIMY